MAAAEIVHEDADAEGMQVPERAQRHLDVLDQQTLRHLQHETLRLEVERLEHLRYLAYEISLGELTHREVDPHRLRVVVFVLAAPQLTLPARLFEHPAPDIGDEPRVFGDVDEIARRHEPALRVLPPQQRFDGHDAAAVERHDWL